jgi:hypothetical protein
MPATQSRTYPLPPIPVDAVDHHSPAISAPPCLLAPHTPSSAGVAASLPCFAAKKKEKEIKDEEQGRRTQGKRYEPEN